MRCDNCGRDSSRGRSVELIAGTEIKQKTGDYVRTTRFDFSPFSAWFCADCIRERRKSSLLMFGSAVTIGAFSLAIGSRFASFARSKLMLGMAGLTFFGALAFVNALVTTDLKDLFGERLKQLVRERTGKNAFWTLKEFESMKSSSKTP